MPSNRFEDPRSEEAQEVIDVPPSWIINYGTAVIFCILGLMIFLSWFIKYPDIVSARLKLTSTNSPKSIVSKASGRLLHLDARDGCLVNAGSVIGIIESSADYNQVNLLSMTIDSLLRGLEKGTENYTIDRRLPNLNNLGDLQVHFQNLKQSNIELNAYLNEGYFNKKLEILRQEAKKLAERGQELMAQRYMQDEDLSIAADEFRIHQKLAQDRVISPLDYGREKSKLLNRKLIISQSSLLANENASAELRKKGEILDLERQLREGKDRYVQQLNIMRSQIDQWMNTYVIKSPSNGKLFLAAGIQENSTVQSNELICTVDAGDGSVYGQLYLRQRNLGKVDLGQHVLVKFEGLPAQDYGTFDGVISQIADVPQGDSTFLAKVIFPMGLRSSFGMRFAYRSGMRANAEIITNDRSLLNRLFSELLLVFS